ncbi:ribokinase [Actinopolyspora xinjiangensis]|uniref:Ribokinase n=2 Tax=Actinopolyspora xinjiangensis TaxID=405564 RepID=A0A1H0W436_9ACTN|nr:ribokinase [Actinopolyspora xinjiangensis]SDP85497.1 ribokinase [Actinopolyspora xinjiangensis]
MHDAPAALAAPANRRDGNYGPVTMVTVFGSCNMDLVAYVATPPRRGETVHGRTFSTVPGGKGANQAIAAARAEVGTRFLGAVGDDEFGGRIRATLAEAGVETTGLRTVEGHSGTAHIVVDDDGGNSIVVVGGANDAMDRLRSGDAETIAASDCLLLQLETPLRGASAAAEVAAAHGVRVVLTPAPAEPVPDSLLSNVNLLVPNEHEAAVLTGESDPERALTSLLDSVPEVVVTMGGEGVLYGNRSGERVRMPAFPVRPVDTTAAGDTFVGVLAAELARGTDTTEALRHGSGAAALSIRRKGASGSMPSREDIREFLEEADS